MRNKVSFAKTNCVSPDKTLFNTEDNIAINIKTGATQVLVQSLWNTICNFVCSNKDCD